MGARRLETAGSHASTEVRSSQRGGVVAGEDQPALLLGVRERGDLGSELVSEEGREADAGA
jgi:hypothetical protein